MPPVDTHLPGLGRRSRPLRSTGSTAAPATSRSRLHRLHCPGAVHDLLESIKTAVCTTHDMPHAEVPKLWFSANPRPAYLADPVTGWASVVPVRRRHRDNRIIDRRPDAAPTHCCFKPPRPNAARRGSRATTSGLHGYLSVVSGDDQDQAFLRWSRRDRLRLRARRVGDLRALARITSWVVRSDAARLGSLDPRGRGEAMIAGLKAPGHQVTAMRGRSGRCRSLRSTRRA